VVENTEKKNEQATTFDRFISSLLSLQVAMDHVCELDGEEDEDSWVSQMFVYWSGALGLLMYTDSDKPYEVHPHCTVHPVAHALLITTHRRR
jgi:hypothetical protein